LLLSSASRKRVGSRADSLVEEVRRLLASFAFAGMVAEVVESPAFIAKQVPPVCRTSARWRTNSLTEDAIRSEHNVHSAVLRLVWTSPRLVDTQLRV
jgi:hypothetical protein